MSGRSSWWTYSFCRCVRVGEVQAGERDVDEHLAGPGDRIGKLDQLEHFGPTELTLLDRAHGRER